MKKRKKGAIAIIAIFIIIMLLVFSVIMVNLQQGMQMVTRMNQVAEEGASVRAQAVDILLKEQEGIIEIYHHTGSNYQDNVDHASHAKKYGHQNPVLPGNSDYQNAKKKADEFAKESIMSYYKNAIRAEVSNSKQIVSFDKNDICFDFKPLPDGSLYEDFDPEKADKKELDVKHKLDFSCTTPNGDVIKAKNVPVSGIKDNTVKVDEKNGKAKTIKVANVVFVGISFEYSFFINKTFQDLGIENTQEGKVWAVAYPQVDKCVRSDASCTY